MPKVLAFGGLQAASVEITLLTAVKAPAVGGHVHTIRQPHGPQLRDAYLTPLGIIYLG